MADPGNSERPDRLGAFRLTPLALHPTLFLDEGLAGFLLRNLGISAILGAMLLRCLDLHHLLRLQIEAEARTTFPTTPDRLH